MIVQGLENLLNSTVNTVSKHKGSSESFFVQYLKSTGSNIRLGPSSYHLSVESVLLDLGHHHQDDRVLFSGVKLTSIKSTIHKRFSEKVHNQTSGFQAELTTLAIAINDAHCDCSWTAHRSTIKIQTFYSTECAVVYLQISLRSLLIHRMSQNQKAIT